MTEPYRIRSPETWDAARDAYMAGESADSVCSRFDLGLRTFRARAADEGWRRTDHPDPEPLDLTAGLADDPDLPDPDDAELRRLARTRMAQAARRGLVGEALRWARFGEAVARQSEAAERAAREEARQRTRDDHAASRRSSEILRDTSAAARSLEVQARTILATRKAEVAVHDLHDLHADSDRPPAPAPDPVPLNRADRRRMMKAGPKRR